MGDHTSAGTGGTFRYLLCHASWNWLAEKESRSESKAIVAAPCTVLCQLRSFIPGERE